MKMTSEFEIKTVFIEEGENNYQVARGDFFSMLLLKKKMYSSAMMLKLDLDHNHKMHLIVFFS